MAVWRAVHCKLSQNHKPAFPSTSVSECVSLKGRQPYTRLITATCPLVSREQHQYSKFWSRERSDSLRSPAITAVHSPSSIQSSIQTLAIKIAFWNLSLCELIHSSVSHLHLLWKQAFNLPTSSSTKWKLSKRWHFANFKPKLFIPFFFFLSLKISSHLQV